MSTSKSNESIAEQWFEAFNEHNLEKLLELYDENAAHFSPKLKIRIPTTNGFVKGKPALRSWWKDCFDRLPELKYLPKTLTANESRIFMEYLRQVPGEANMMVAEVLEICNGKISASRVYHG